LQKSPIKKVIQNNGTKTPAPHPRESRQKLLMQFFPNQRRPFCPAIIQNKSPPNPAWRPASREQKNMG